MNKTSQTPPCITPQPRILARFVDQDQQSVGWESRLHQEFAALDQRLNDTHYLREMAIALLRDRYIAVPHKSKKMWSYIPENQHGFVLVDCPFHGNVPIEPVKQPMIAQLRLQYSEKIDTIATRMSKQLKDKTMLTKILEWLHCKRVSANTAIDSRINAQLIAELIGGNELDDADFERLQNTAVDHVLDRRSQIYNCSSDSSIELARLKFLRMTYKLGVAIEPREVFNTNNYQRELIAAFGDTNRANSFTAIIGYALFTGRCRLELHGIFLQLGGIGATAIMSHIASVAGDYHASVDPIDCIAATASASDIHLQGKRIITMPNTQHTSAALKRLMHKTNALIVIVDDQNSTPLNKHQGLVFFPVQQPSPTPLGTSVSADYHSTIGATLLSAMKRARQCWNGYTSSIVTQIKAQSDAHYGARPFTAQIIKRFVADRQWDSKGTQPQRMAIAELVSPIMELASTSLGFSTFQIDQKAIVQALSALEYKCTRPANKWNVTFFKNNDSD